MREHFSIDSIEKWKKKRKLSNEFGRSSFLFYHHHHSPSFSRESIYLTKDKVSKMEENKNQLENDIDRAKDQQNV